MTGYIELLSEREMFMVALDVASLRGFFFLHEITRIEADYSPIIASLVHVLPSFEL